MGTISAFQASGMHYFSNTNELLQKNNNYSSEAKYLQQDLATLGYSTNGVDGYFGNNTYNALKAFQRDNGLSQDGIAGNQTLSKIDSLINQAKNQNVQNSSSGSKGDSISISGNLSKGMQGTAVSDLQSSLTKLGYSTYGVDGVFGQNTYNAVVAFQKAHGLTQDGIVGNQTKSAITSALSSKSSISTSTNLQMGSTGDTVKQLQSNLTKLGFNTYGVDGVFGQNTYNAVVAFQSAKGLTQDGIVGSQTQSAISAALSSNSNSFSIVNNGIGVTNNNSNGSMKVSDELVDFVASYESFSATEYRGADSQNLTIGYGHVVKSGEQFSKITEDQAKELLKQDLQSAANSVIQYTKGVNLSQQQFDALVSFTYNVGAGDPARGIQGFSTSTLHKDVISGNASNEKITADFQAWDYCNGQPLLGLWRRRTDEANMYTQGNYERTYQNW
jgi:peptidoglycan hydrolase-like protein with peptidoglycan-binding domain